MIRRRSRRLRTGQGWIALLAGLAGAVLASSILLALVGTSPDDLLASRRQAEVLRVQRDAANARAQAAETRARQAEARAAKTQAALAELLDQLAGADNAAERARILDRYRRSATSSTTSSSRTATSSGASSPTRSSSGSAGSSGATPRPGASPAPASSPAPGAPPAPPAPSTPPPSQPGQGDGGGSGLHLCKVRVIDTLCAVIN